eukprot:CAMPEP_0197587234 /NCGR_PEP_ID=MMETSP1326-20131121/8932_1 /TAXON_ID=1155430 /ORGANISM="Genus nov. species nov., Strain RCC2288" /LENGTH=44 /DNA_ID= /DNA_START= /DNA_END= /DNA_ORIENTATION=
MSSPDASASSSDASSDASDAKYAALMQAQFDAEHAGILADEAAG